MSSEIEPQAGGSPAGEEHVGPNRVIGTPPPAPAAVDRSADSGDGAVEKLQTDPEDMRHASNVEKVVVACFILAFLAGCGFIAAYIGLEVGSLDSTFRSNLALGTSLAVTLLALALGSLLWVRHLTPNIETVEYRHDLRSDEADRKTFGKMFMEGAEVSQIPKRPLLRRTMLLATAPLALLPVVLLRDLGPLPGTSLRHTVWKRGTRIVVYGTNRPLTPADIAAPGSMITVIPEGYQDDPEALAKAGTILIKFAPGELDIPTRYDGGTMVGTMNWTVDNIVAYSKICTHVGCPVALYEQTTHHILCPCHQSTFDASTGATVIFGPAARPLPQLPMMLNSDGYLVAASDYTQPVGPSFWERG